MKRGEKSDGRRRLRLERETIKVLADQDLAQVNGGALGGGYIIIAVPKPSRCCTTEAP